MHDGPPGGWGRVFNVISRVGMCRKVLHATLASRPTDALDHLAAHDTANPPHKASEQPDDLAE